MNLTITPNLTTPNCKTNAVKQNASKQQSFGMVIDPCLADEVNKLAPEVQQYIETCGFWEFLKKIQNRGNDKMLIKIGFNPDVKDSILSSMSCTEHEHDTFTARITAISPYTQFKDTTLRCYERVRIISERWGIKDFLAKEGSDEGLKSLDKQALEYIESVKNITELNAAKEEANKEINEKIRANVNVHLKELELLPASKNIDAGSNAHLEKSGLG